MQPTAYLKRDGAELPPPNLDEPRYILAANGLFVERRSEIFTTSARVYTHDLSLDDHAESCRLHCPKLPRAMTRLMLGFFKIANAVHGGEVALVLLYEPERRVYRWHCPDQTVEQYYSSYRKEWIADDTIRFENPLELPEGFIHFGDAHLHHGAPTPSSLDMLDDQDGMHIIVGEIDSRPRYNVDFVIDRRRFRIAPESFFEDVNCTPFEKVPRPWIDCVHTKRRTQSNTDWGNNGWNYDPWKPGKSSHGRW
jgi:hypothetical protein